MAAANAACGRQPTSRHREKPTGRPKGPPSAFLAAPMKRRYALVLSAFLLTGVFAAWSANAEQRRFLPPAKGWSPAEAAATCQAECIRPCSTWAKSQEDFQLSYGVCTAKCLNAPPCNITDVSRNRDGQDRP
jgi:hypothetical protein